MATNNQINTALIQVAQKLLGRSLTETEQIALIAAFASASGSDYQKTISSVAKVSSLNENVIKVKAASSDDADKAMKDLERLLKGGN